MQNLSIGEAAMILCCTHDEVKKLIQEGYFPNHRKPDIFTFEIPMSDINAYKMHLVTEIGMYRRSVWRWTRMEDGIPDKRKKNK